jgi:hypothetical protein
VFGVKFVVCMGPTARCNRCAIRCSLQIAIGVYAQQHLLPFPWSLETLNVPAYDFQKV